MFESSVQGYRLFGNRMAHAEMNALLALGQDVDPRTCALYTTTEPCPMCIGAIRMHTIGKVCYASRDPVAGSIAFATATPFMLRFPIVAVGPPHGALESALLAVLAEFSLRRKSRWPELAETWNPACAPAVRLGRSLFESGELARLRADGATAGEVFEPLARRVKAG
jgi:tRNA(adenine34) deaminase